MNNVFRKHRYLWALSVLLFAATAAAVQHQERLAAGTGISISGPVDNADGTHTFTVTNTSPSAGGTLTSSSVTGSGVWWSTSGTLESAAVALQGDLTAGSHASGTQNYQVTALRGNVLPTLTAGYLNWSGSAWQFATPSAAGAAGGDLSGSYPNPTVISVANITTGTLGVNHGGTGQTSLAAHGPLIGNGTSGIVIGGAGASGQVWTSNGAASDPTFQAPAAVAPATGAQFAEHTSAGSGTAIARGSYTSLLSDTVTVATGQKVVCIGSFEAQSSAADSYQYGINIDGGGGVNSTTHRVDTSAASLEVGGTVTYLASGLSAGTHTINLYVQGTTIGGAASGGGSLTAYVVAN